MFQKNKFQGAHIFQLLVLGAPFRGSIFIMTDLM